MSPLIRAVGTRYAASVLCAIAVSGLVAFTSRADESWPYQACDDNGQCQRFRTEAEFKRYVEQYRQEHLARRREALSQLPVDERDCALAVLADVLDATGALREEDGRIYVTIGDEDIDAVRQERLAQRNIRVLPGSSLGSVKHVPVAQHTRYWSFTVAITGMSDTRDTFEFAATYHCGSLCAGRINYRVKVTGTSCSVLTKQPQWMA